MAAAWAFCWGSAAASGVLIGAVLGLIANLRHRSITAILSLGAGVLLSVVSVELTTEALMLAGIASTAGGILAGAATFSIANVALAAAKDRKRSGEFSITHKPHAEGGAEPNIGEAREAAPQDHGDGRRILGARDSRRAGRSWSDSRKGWFCRNSFFPLSDYGLRWWEQVTRGVQGQAI